MKSNSSKIWILCGFLATFANAVTLESQPGGSDKNLTETSGHRSRRDLTKQWTLHVWSNWEVCISCSCMSDPVPNGAFMWSCAPNDNQKFYLAKPDGSEASPPAWNRDPDNPYKIISVRKGLCMEATPKGELDVNWLQWAECNADSTSQQWNAKLPWSNQDWSNTAYAQLESVEYPGNCVTPREWSISNGAKLHLWPCTSNSNKWYNQFTWWAV